MQQDECNRIFERIFKKANGEWERFIGRLKKLSDPEDQNMIALEDFENILLRYKIKLSNGDLEMLVLAFPGRSEEGRERINIGKLYD
jgi:hypothetical protein